MQVATARQVHPSSSPRKKKLVRWHDACRTIGKRWRLSTEVVPVLVRARRAGSAAAEPNLRIFTTSPHHRHHYYHHPLPPVHLNTRPPVLKSLRPLPPPDHSDFYSSLAHRSPTASSVASATSVLTSIPGPENAGTVPRANHFT